MIDLNLEKKIEKINLLFRIHRYDGAEDILSSLEKEFPGLAKEIPIDSLRAVSLYKQSKLDLAIEHLKNSISEHPDSIELKLCLAACLSDIGSYEEAAIVFSHCKKLGFSSYKTSLEAEFRRKSAELEKFLGNLDETIKELEEVKTLKSCSLKTQLETALAYLEKKNFMKASLELENLCKVYPSSVRIHTLLGLAHFSSGRISKAKEAWEKAIEINPEARDPKIFLNNITRVHKTES